MLTNFVKISICCGGQALVPKVTVLICSSFDTLKLWKQILADSTEADVPAIKVVDDSNLLVDGNIKTIRRPESSETSS